MNTASRSEHEEAEDAPALPFETWVQIAAKMLERSASQKLELLQNHNVKPEDWTPSDEHWTAILASDIAAGDFTRADVYALVCLEEMQARKPPQEKASPEPEKAGGVHPLQGTSLALDIPKGPALPFVPPVKGQTPLIEAAANPREHLATAPKVPLGTTYELPDLSAIIRAVLPFKKGAGEENGGPPAPVEANAASSGAEGEGLGLTLVQYASLCAELELGPELAHETLKRYRLSPDQKARLDTRFRAQFRSDSQAHAAFEHAKSTYTAWLRGTRRGP